MSMSKTVHCRFTRRRRGLRTSARKSRHHRRPDSQNLRAQKCKGADGSPGIKELHGKTSAKLLTPLISFTLIDELNRSSGARTMCRSV